MTIRAYDFPRIKLNKSKLFELIDDDQGFLTYCNEAFLNKLEKTKRVYREQGYIEVTKSNLINSMINDIEEYDTDLIMFNNREIKIKTFAKKLK